MILFMIIQSLTDYILYRLLKNYFLIGLTGNIGSGKSTILKFIKNYRTEIATIDTD